MRAKIHCASIIRMWLPNIESTSLPTIYLVTSFKAKNEQAQFLILQSSRVFLPIHIFGSLNTDDVNGLQ